ncbi:hypothetical protein BDY21DRAFT_96278 [Lineolata rhizophorae]|uniref:Uncharacterized protein n=1 Tax=Lineolata rhizophorae TaxID=578093 RepID=A0A6A6NTQ2_9PEZI|nr:hypothetical protein BDY21DRAFT_96278 [Lineolata rhizophorae]
MRNVVDLVRAATCSSRTRAWMPGHQGPWPPFVDGCLFPRRRFPPSLSPLRVCAARAYCSVPTEALGLLLAAPCRSSSVLHALRAGPDIGADARASFVQIIRDCLSARERDVLRKLRRCCSERAAQWKNTITCYERVAGQIGHEAAGPSRRRSVSWGRGEGQARRAATVGSGSARNSYEARDAIMVPWARRGPANAPPNTVVSSRKPAALPMIVVTNHAALQGSFELGRRRPISANTEKGKQIHSS